MSAAAANEVGEIYGFFYNHTLSRWAATVVRTRGPSLSLLLELIAINGSPRQPAIGSAE